MSPTELILLGLGLDLLGAGLIVWPLLYRKYHDRIPRSVSGGSIDEIEKKDIRTWLSTVAGFFLLIGGFILQIIGNYFSNS